VKEQCLIASGNTPYKLRRALWSLRRYAPGLDPVVLHAPQHPTHDPEIEEVSTGFGAKYFVVPREVLSRRVPAARHGESLDWYLERVRPGGVHVWFMDSDATLLSKKAVEKTENQAAPLCGIFHARTKGYTYARPAWMAVDMEWLFRHSPPWCALSRRARYRQRPGVDPGDPREGGFDTCELLTIWCRLEGLPIGMLPLVNGKYPGEKNAIAGVDGVSLVYHEGGGTSRVKWGRRVYRREWPTNEN
jgi:hypothetical protein